MTNTTNAAPTVLTDKVKELKLIARNALRMELINPILAEINRIEKDIQFVQKSIEGENKQIDIASYKIARLLRLDAEHPDFDNLKKTQEEIITSRTQRIENLKKEIETQNKYIQNEKEYLTKIETGETLVNSDYLNDLVNKLILQDAKNTIIS